jgi:hypothetical protein
MIPPSPIAIDSAINPDEASISEAPADLRPCTTTAKELENPTNPARSPAATAWIENNQLWFDIDSNSPLWTFRILKWS